MEKSVPKKFWFFILGSFIIFIKTPIFRQIFYCYLPTEFFYCNRKSRNLLSLKESICNNIILIGIWVTSFCVVMFSDSAKFTLLWLFQIGGRSDVPNEVLCRFVFPEKPGALMKFLDSFNPCLSISLFHYRAHVGIQFLVFFTFHGVDRTKVL